MLARFLHARATRRIVAAGVLAAAALGVFATLGGATSTITTLAMVDASKTDSDASGATPAPGSVVRLRVVVSSDTLRSLAFDEVDRRRRCQTARTPTGTATTARVRLARQLHAARVRHRSPPPPALPEQRLHRDAEQHEVGHPAPSARVATNGPLTQAVRAPHRDGARRVGLDLPGPRRNRRASATAPRRS